MAKIRAQPIATRSLSSVSELAAFLDLNVTCSKVFVSIIASEILVGVIAMCIQANTNGPRISGASGLTFYRIMGNFSRNNPKAI